MSIMVRPATAQRWGDVTGVFAGPDGSSCWCRRFRRASGSDRSTALRHEMERASAPVGLVAHVDDSRWGGVASCRGRRYLELRRAGHCNVSTSTTTPIPRGGSVALPSAARIAAAVLVSRCCAVRSDSRTSNAEERVAAIGIHPLCGHVVAPELQDFTPGRVVPAQPRKWMSGDIESGWSFMRMARSRSTQGSRRSAPRRPNSPSSTLADPASEPRRPTSPQRAHVDRRTDHPATGARDSRRTAD